MYLFIINFYEFTIIDVKIYSKSIANISCIVIDGQSQIDAKGNNKIAPVISIPDEQTL